MKKSLLALAVLGAFATAAQAQANVQIGGRIQADIKNYKVSNTTRAAKNEFRIDDDETSRFWLSGTEDLGGGLKALFYVENRFNTDVNNVQGDGNGLANGNTYVGLSGGWGQLTAGKHTMMEDQGNAVQYGIKGGQAIPSALLGSKSILNFVGNTGISTSRVNNSILYITPNFGGFKGTVGYSTNAAGVEGNLACTGNGVTAINTVAAPVAGASTATCPTVPAAGSDYSKGQVYFLAGNYSNGPIYVNLAYFNNQIEGNPASGDQKQIRLSGSYAFPFGLKIGAQWDRATLENVAGDRERNAWQIPVSYQFGNNTVLASFTKASDTKNLAGDNGAKLWTIGYDYAFSKRTNVGVFYGKLDNEAAGLYQPYKSGTSQNGSVLLAGESGSIFAVSVKHVF